VTKYIAPSVTQVCVECRGEGKYEADVCRGSQVLRTVIVDPCEGCNGGGTQAWCDSCGWVPWEEDTWTLEKDDLGMAEYCLTCTEDYAKWLQKKELGKEEV